MSGRKQGKCLIDRKTQQRLPLKWSMIGMLGLVWLLPLLLIGFCMLYFVSSMIERQVEKAIVISTDKAVEICDMQLNEILNASKSASYQTTVRDSYLQYKEDGKHMDLYNAIHSFLEQQYRYDRNFLCTMVFFLDEPEYPYYTYNTYQDNNTGTTGYARVEEFRENYIEDALAASAELDTRHALLIKEGRLYMLRNLVGSDFTPYGMIIIEMSPGWVFESLNSVWGALEYQIYLDGEPIFQKDFDSVDLEWIRREAQDSSGYINDYRGAYSYHVARNGQQELIYVVKLDSKMLISDVTMLRSLLILVAIFIIPLIFIIFWFFHTKVTKPIAILVNASGEITAGKYGHLVEETSNSQEFDYLNNAFNAMSIELKYQFEQIYLEELALKDANIMALQSQINPHFLNNTLEIINWEARMKGDEKISKMIEALSTMLNATMNREHKRYVALWEEMEYVNAYLYIIQQRQGERFRVEREIDSGLLNIEVPMLIIQPIVENAVKHGMNGRKNGWVRIRIYRMEDVMHVEVINHGALSGEDKARIEYLLGGEEQDKNGQHISLGIRNVDQRLKIIYGEDYGLSINNYNENQTISTILIKLDKSGNNNQ